MLRSLIILGLSLTISFIQPSIIHAAPTVADLFQQLTPTTHWQLVATIPLQFDAHHPQGLVKVGRHFYLTTVDRPLPVQQIMLNLLGLTTSTHTGTGYLMKFDAKGQLRAKISLGDRQHVHPGGLDFDGTELWVPVAQYRPKSSSIIYRVDPNTMRSTEAFRTSDHIGAMAIDESNGMVVGVNWGAHALYAWDADGQLQSQHRNTQQYIAYQDCHYAGTHTMLCSGLKSLINPLSGLVQLGGLDLVDMRSLRATHQLAIDINTSSNLTMTRNAVAFAVYKDQLRFYFIPEDHPATLYVYDALPQASVILREQRD